MLKSSQRGSPDGGISGWIIAFANALADRVARISGGAPVDRRPATRVLRCVRGQVHRSVAIKVTARGFANSRVQHGRLYIGLRVSPWRNRDGAVPPASNLREVKILPEPVAARAEREINEPCDSAAWCIFSVRPFDIDDPCFVIAGKPAQRENRL